MQRVVFKMRSIRIILLENLSPIRQYLRYLNLKISGYSNISVKAIIESNVLLDKVYPAGITIKDFTLVAANVTILCHEHIFREEHDRSMSLMKPVVIGERCFIGVGAMILPGVTIGDDCVVGAAAVVHKDVPAGSICAGNPARIIRSGIKMNDRAMLVEVD